MNDESNPGIEVLCQKIKAKESEIITLKTVVNGLCADENRPPLYPNVEIQSVAASQLRSDLFYGETMSGAARQYLEMRKTSGQGAASVETIYQALKSGGYRFETKNETNAKTGVRLSLRKNSATFHRLPNGDYGLGIWYGVKANQENSDAIPKKRKGKHRKRAVTPKATDAAERPKSQPGVAQNGIHGANGATEAKRSDHGTTTSAGVITVGQLESFVRKKSRRIKQVAEHFKVDESVVTKMLEAESKVCLAERGWLKIRE